jgi:hypothetical protein
MYELESTKVDFFISIDFHRPSAAPEGPTGAGSDPIGRK